jgi:hypothetical protein
LVRIGVVMVVTMTMTPVLFMMADGDILVAAGCNGGK